jgi:hypothetical protein
MGVIGKERESPRAQREEDYVGHGHTFGFG